MVDVTGKEEVLREAVAEGLIRLRPETLRRVLEGRVEKGDVFESTKVAVIQAVKRTSEILPYCHNVPITYVGVELEPEGEDALRLRVTVRSVGRTGVEMEALVGVAAGLLNVWDMVKKYEKDERGQYPYTRIEGIRVLRKEKSQPS
ncbi:MAG: cyclic pyranopterin monophosphate synthase MoaC [Desulfurococcaceae archaeon]